ncbi:Multidrug resistance ABC transporter ATP-binding/permease protein BmrA [compost metagenome]
MDGFSLTSLDRTQIIALVGAFIAQTVAAGISIFLLNYMGQKVVAALRDRLWKKLLVLPVRYFDNHQTGDSVSRMTSDTGVIKNFYFRAFGKLLQRYHFDYRLYSSAALFELENDINYVHRLSHCGPNPNATWA